MYLVTRNALVALSLATLASITGCVEPDGGDVDTGTVGLNLVGQSSSGATYRLRSATINVDGASSQVWNTEDEPELTSLSANVLTGNYTATLQPGWRLERLVNGGPAVMVPAMLLSPNPIGFAVTSLQRTAVPISFAVDGAVVDLSQGYDITIGIQDPVTSIVTPVSALTVLEGGTATVGIRLATQPVDPVVVAVTSSDAGAATGAPATLTFTSLNFATPQNITVTGVNDADLANEAVTLSLTSNGLFTRTLAVAVIDDDTQSIMTTTTSLSIDEGGTGTVGVRLALAPSASVTVTVASSDTGAAAFTPATLTFTTVNFATRQNVTVTGVEDADLTNETVGLTLASTGLANRTVTVSVRDNDTVAPTVTITGGPAGVTNDSTPTFTFTTTGAPTTTECRIGAGTFAACVSPFTTAALADGPYTFEVRAAGAPVPATRTFTVDTVAPTATITGGPAGPTNDSTPTFTFTTAGAPTATQCRIDAGTFALCASPFTPAALADGAHTVTVQVVDAAGNSASATRTFAIDTTAPTVTITGGPAGVTNDNTPTFTFTTGGAPTATECRIAGVFAACAATFTSAPLVDGAHVVEIRVTDAAGNAATATRAFTVDATAPTAVITSGPQSSAASVETFTFTTGGGPISVQCRHYLRGQPSGTYVNCASPQSWTMPHAPNGATTDYTFEVRVTDAAGNAASAFWNFTTFILG